MSPFWVQRLKGLHVALDLADILKRLHDIGRDLLNPPIACEWVVFQTYGSRAGCAGCSMSIPASVPGTSGGRHVNILYIIHSHQ